MGRLLASQPKLNKQSTHRSATYPAGDVPENTYYRWRNQFGGIKADEMKRLKELEKENARLKALVADLVLDKAILQEAARGNS